MITSQASPAAQSAKLRSGCSPTAPAQVPECSHWRSLLPQHEPQYSLRHRRPTQPHRPAVNANRPSPRVANHHHPGSFIISPPSNAIVSAAWRKDDRIGQAVAEPVLMVRPTPTGRLPQKPLDFSLPYQSLQDPLHSAFGTEPSTQVLPRGPVLQEPEDPGQCQALLAYRVVVCGGLRSIYRSSIRAVECHICQSQYNTMTAAPPAPHLSTAIASRLPCRISQQWLQSTVRTTPLRICHPSGGTSTYTQAPNSAPPLNAKYICAVP